LEFAESSGRFAGNAYHSLEVGMVWNHPHQEAADAASEAALGKQMHTAWSAFIRGETPAAPGLPAWPQYNVQSRSTMIFGANGNAESRVEQAPQAAELSLWNEIL
jgi:para-nitrobenzyl esterase